jgi:hypothetical protein
MVFELPNLRSGRASRLIACGAILTDNKKLLEWLGSERQLIAAYGKGGVRHFAQLITGGRKKKHFHLEVASADWFRDAGVPSTNSKISEIHDAIERVIGIKIALNLGADFLIRSEELPEAGPIRILSAKTQAAGTTIELTGGVLSVAGSRITQISWRRIDETRTMITLHAYLDSTVAPKYLFDSQDLMERFFKVLVLAQPTSGS